MTTDRPKNILFVTDHVVGRPFLQEVVRLGHKAYVLTNQSGLKENWPRDILTDIWGIPYLTKDETFETVRKVVGYLHRTTKFDRIIAPSDWTVELVARLREHLRVPGMGDTTTRYFRDKLAMRMKAHEDGLPVPEFVPLFNWEEIHAYLDRVAPPWVVKPRLMAASQGVKKINKRDELWPVLDKLGDDMALNLLEKYIAGPVYHVDSVVSEREVVFAPVSGYGTPMLDLNLSGGVYTTRLLKRGSPDEVALRELNEQVIKTLGLVRGVTHIEYIKSAEDGKFYFLEAAARVGAGRIPNVIWFGTDICLWWEWAKIEGLDDHVRYHLPSGRDGYAGTVITLARTENPDLSGYTDPEICFRQARKHHAGLIVQSDSPERVEELLTQYTERFRRDFMAHKVFEER